jgi:hypothetical protein
MEETICSISKVVDKKWDAFHEIIQNYVAQM